MDELGWVQMDAAGEELETEEKQEPNAERWLWSDANMKSRLQTNSGRFVGGLINSHPPQTRTNQTYYKAKSYLVFFLTTKTPNFKQILLILFVNVNSNLIPGRFDPQYKYDLS